MDANKNIFAYFIESCAPGDINNDGRVDIADLAIVAAAFNTSPPSNEVADINRDNIVDIQDLAEAAVNFGFVAPL